MVRVGIENMFSEMGKSKRVHDTIVATGSCFTTLAQFTESIASRLCTNFHFCIQMAIVGALV